MYEEEFIEGDIIEDDQCIVDIDDRCLRLRGGGLEIPQVELWKHYDNKRAAMTRLRNRYEEFREHPNYRNIKKGLERRRRIRRDSWFESIDKQERGNVDPLKYDDYMQQLREAAEDSIASIGTGVAAGAGTKKYINYIKKGNKKFKKDFEFDMGYQPDEPPPSAGPPPFVYEEFAGEPDNNLNNNMPMRLRNEKNDGRDVLNKRMETQKMYTTMCEYSMSAIKDVSQPSGGSYMHELEQGKGPCLYTTYDYALTDSTGSRNQNWNSPKDTDANMTQTATACRGVGTTSTVYIFAADWPWLMMNHDELTQSTGGTYDTYTQLQWNYVPYTSNTNDPNLPLTTSNFLTNPDWKYIKVFGIDYTFDFTNFDMRPYVVEILLFKFKADPDSMDYAMQCRAPYQRQTNGFRNYTVRAKAQYASPDITIVDRKRVVIRGMDSPAYINAKWSVIPRGASNCQRHTMRIKRQYVITRPILADALTVLSEKDWFNDYYEPHKGIYCRMQAWPMSGAFTLNLQDATIALNKNETIDDLCEPGSASSQATTLAPGLDVRILKKAYYKFDSERIKALST